MADEKKTQNTKPAEEEKKEEEELDLPYVPIPPPSPSLPTPPCAVFVADCIGNSNVWMKISINGKPFKTSSGHDRIVYQLYDDLCPKTCANFRSLCTGRHPGPNVSATFKALCPGLTCDGSPLPSTFAYAPSTPFHRVIPGFMVQSGDFERRDGTGGVSIYGELFADEKVGLGGPLPSAVRAKEKEKEQKVEEEQKEKEGKEGEGEKEKEGEKKVEKRERLKFDKEGILAMANNGKDANGSQFFVTTVNECEWLDGKHVIFGEVIEGYDIIKEIESRGNKEGKMPRDKILIAAAGAV
ncbi:peptidyl-prolyl cis-trans isomerase [Cryptococcus wingfieldii CBS 7118]|uniref:peptidylprolyl isomerase n=1 Tax=Cryptococcus wingfieldii CBS 7118 TaxID=1295528 RepID=A0A1E3JIX4_9TREE|nr:peptidyl-prolyl cis-trans isomerase [Cryptococcus wingfieldii CBS 7118]ODO00586.1 peptidyl-prolyl cis-trans isomerase [Cryptococcus wingfieldii CBS 7118]